jgi:TPP-dependent pyruvate/acetoin dehydrogenase alpha subunit
VVFVLENNHYGVSTRIEESTAVEDLSIRAQGYGMPGVRVDGFDILAVYRAASEAVARARRGDGPTLLVTESYRFEGHYSGEPEVYRSRGVVEEWRKHDPIPRFRLWLTDNGRVTSDELSAIETAMTQEIAEAVQFAKDSPQPDPATAMDFIYA